MMLRFGRGRGYSEPNDSKRPRWVKASQTGKIRKDGGFHKTKDIAQKLIQKNQGGGPFCWERPIGGVGTTKEAMLLDLV